MDGPGFLQSSELQRRAKSSQVAGQRPALAVSREYLPSYGLDWRTKPSQVVSPVARVGRWSRVFHFLHVAMAYKLVIGRRTSVMRCVPTGGDFVPTQPCRSCV
jgi:hypothetical protein